MFVSKQMNKEPKCKPSSVITTSLKMWYKLSKLVMFFFVFTTSSAASYRFNYLTAYTDHCASFVPESDPKDYVLGKPYQYRHTGYYTGGGSGGILSPNSSYQVQKSIVFYTRSIIETNVQGLFKLQGSIRFPRASTYHFVGNYTSNKYGSASHRWRSIAFSLDGFWSQSAGKLCMVGSGYGYLHNVHSVLKLYNFMNSTSVTSMISGTLESLMGSENDPNDFEPISILIFPSMNYQYTLVSNKSENRSSSGGSEDSNPTSSLKMERFCSVLSREVLNHEFDLKYSSGCASAKNCTPLAVSDLPRVVSLKSIECLEDERSLRVLVEFAESNSLWYQRPFNPNKTLVGEGSWNTKKNHLSVVACQFLDAASSWNNVRVGNCSTRLSLKIPAIWTIGNTSSIVGHIWSNKTATESGYLEQITFESPQDDIGRVLIPGLKYKYTKMDKVTKLCPRKKAAHDKTNVYPNPFSYEMRFDVSAKNSKGEVAWGSSVPLSVGNQFYQPYWYSTASTDEYSVGFAPVSSPVTVSYSNNQSNPYNISYTIRITLLSYAKSGNVSIINDTQIFAEGIYDETEGSLCMVGCRNLGSKNQQPTNDSVDCDIVVNFQFPPTNPSKKWSLIKGSIKSTRKKSDPRHFESWDLSSASSYLVEERRSIWRMDVEITLVLVSTTLSCVFVALQLFHVKKYPDVLPSISIFMLLILTLGYMIPLMLNFEAMFANSTNSRSVFLGSGGWLEVNEVIVRVITMVAFLLQIRLLQLTWSARSATGTQKELWIMERKTLFVVLLIYVAGALAALLLHTLNWRKSLNNGSITAYPGAGHQQRSHLGTAVKSYAGLVLDGFLLPQILLNMFCKSREKALSVSFYIGTTFVRALPHAYDLYRAHNSAHHPLDESYLFASPVADFYSTAWDVIIPFGGLLFAGIIYLQQRFGGLCILPQKLRELGAYEKVRTVTEG
ncbi:PREDICTED: uncharacterized protein LOC103326326 [Prunus mume]|uniref:RING-type E3 ubiquitin transferase n=1 Tax=Prunus mume TaxID=102107 RepID=A0ABM0NLZ0_PRUMU|nr:PREDICTED: uncharacterized protein LOC103326326 [Prunus mume]